MFELAAVTFKAKHSGLLAYLHDELQECKPSTAHLLQRPLILTSVASLAFTVAAPTVWNSMSVNARSADSFANFKRIFTSELFASTGLVISPRPY